MNRGRINWMGHIAGWRCPREACAFGEQEGEGTLVWIAEPEGLAQRQHWGAAVRLTGPALRRVSDVSQWVCVGKGAACSLGSAHPTPFQAPPTTARISLVLGFHKVSAPSVLGSSPSSWAGGKAVTLGTSFNREAARSRLPGLDSGLRCVTSDQMLNFSVPRLLHL